MSRETKPFQTEVKQLLDLVIHSLYSRKEIFLRELISNASDAIDRARFEALTDPRLAVESPRIRLAVDRAARTLTISDNGIGMTREEVERNIGTIANSGTRAFLETLKQAGKQQGPEFIGQFGVGFYSAFMVASQVTLLTRRADGDPASAVFWSSTGDGAYTIEESTREAAGTDVVLHLREGQDEFLDEHRLRHIVKTYSDYVSHPIVLAMPAAGKAGSDGAGPVEEQTLNSMKAIWRKNKSEVTTEEYEDFYRHVSHAFDKPLRVLHFAGEGAAEFRAVLFIPEQPPMDLLQPEHRGGIQLYVHNVMITDDCRELVPNYLRFLRGVVDASDLPLNVSREMLQDNAILRRIRSSIVGRVLKLLGEMKAKENTDYQKYYKAFGRLLKEGVYHDHEHRVKLLDLLQFASTRQDDGTLTDLKSYVGRMPADQAAIYYLAADSLAMAAHAPCLETFRARGCEVLLGADPVDGLVLQEVGKYGDKPLEAVDRGDVELGSPDEKKARADKRDTQAREARDVLALLREQLKGEVKDVRVSIRLTESACCLVADETAPSASLARLMQSMRPGEAPEIPKPILEVNADHAVLRRMQALYEARHDDPRLAEYAELLYGQAQLMDGASLKNPTRFAGLVSRLMAGAGG
ncbi:MAG: molecular chaperone HtpG [Kiritimatiellia bacterium]